MKNKILITGGAGFIGSAFVRSIDLNKNKVCVVDKLTYAGDKKRLEHVNKYIDFRRCNIAHQHKLFSIFKDFRPDTVIHFAAETHVDRSLNDHKPFLETNILGTQQLIDACLQFNVKKMIHVSTDEVYGVRKNHTFKETDVLSPRNPYSAAKAAADHLVLAAYHTYNLPAVIIRPCNIFGPWQYPEKLIPVTIKNALSGKKVPVYGDGKQKREWLYVDDCVRAIHLLIEKGIIGEIYNIGSSIEHENIKTIRRVLKQLNKPDSMIKFTKDRLGHDFQYGINCQKIKQLGWTPSISFNEGLQFTVDWSLKHLNWLKGKS